MNFRQPIWSAYRLFASLVSKTGITKIRVKDRELGTWINILLNGVLFRLIPDPIVSPSHGYRMYHRIDKKRWYGWRYASDYEPETSRLFQRVVKTGATVVDVGAHIGHFTLLAAKLVGNQGRVYAFEPDPLVFALLQKNIKTNELGAYVESIGLAAADTKRKGTLFQAKGGSSLFKTMDSMKKADVDADVTSLDQFFSNRNWPSIDVVKVDTEGAEALVLEGMRELSRKNPNLKLIIELAPSNLQAADTTVERLLILIGELGFNRVSVLLSDLQQYEIPGELPQFLESQDELPSVVNLLCERCIKVGVI